MARLVSVRAASSRGVGRGPAPRAQRKRDPASATGSTRVPACALSAGCLLWANLDDGFWSNPKIEGIGNEATGIFARMVSYCARHTDGEIPEGVARYIAAGSVDAMEALAEAGLIRKRKDGWVIPRFLDYNISRAEDRERRKKAAERTARWRAKNSPEAE